MKRNGTKQNEKKINETEWNATKRNKTKRKQTKRTETQRKENKTKRKQTKRNEMQRNETKNKRIGQKRNETKTNETDRNATKRKQTKRKQYEKKWKQSICDILSVSFIWLNFLLFSFSLLRVCSVNTPTRKLNIISVETSFLISENNHVQNKNLYTQMILYIHCNIILPLQWNHSCRKKSDNRNLLKSLATLASSVCLSVRAL